MDHSTESDYRSMFKAYDIRGTVGIDYQITDFNKLGQALNIWCQARNIRNIVLGWDNRSTSKALVEQLVSGLHNIHVTTLGYATTPYTAWSMKHLDVDACLIVTASHNNWHDNGLKMYINQQQWTAPLSTEQLLEVRDIMLSCDFLYREKDCRSIDLLDAYIASLPGTSMPITWLSCHGVGDRILQRLSNKHALHSVASHQSSLSGPNPALIADWPEDGLSLCIDGDGDRVVARYNGTVITAEEIAITLQPVSLVHDVHFSDAARMLLTSCKCFVSKVGHTHVQQRMIETDAELGFEASGHFFFKTLHSMDDGIYAGLMLASNLDKLQRVGGFVSNILRISCTSPAVVLDHIEQWANNASTQWTNPTSTSEHGFFTQWLVMHQIDIDPLWQQLQLINIDKLDGVKLIFICGWWLIRKSNTESCLSIMYEGNDICSYRALSEFTQRVQAYVQSF